MSDHFVILLFAVLIIALAALFLWIRAHLHGLRARAEEQRALAELNGQVGAFALHVEGLRAAIASLQGQVVQSMDGTRHAMDQRLDTAVRVISDVRQNLGELAEKTTTLAEIGKDIASLQDILRSPKLRGNVGELLLGDLLAQILPAQHFRLQHSFRDGEKVDAAILLHQGLVPVDAKFPLENFQRLQKADTAADKKAMRRAFIQDVKRHVDAIAKKYIRPDENTFDFALMYIPAENVYYETIIKDDELDTGGALFEYAIQKRIIPVSPNSFYAYLQTVLLGLKGLRVEENARAIINELQRTRVEFDRFSEAFRLTGTHIENASAKYSEALKRLEKVDQKLAHLESGSPTLPT